MKKKYPYLKDSPFLKQFDKIKTKEQYVKIIVLDFSEKPIEEIQGKVTGGNLNLDGKSSIRRTANLQMVSTDYKNNLTRVSSLLSINKKVEIEIGFLNNTDLYQTFPMIWFPVGIFVIMNPSISNSDSGINISLQLKDKMCLLNGECGGTFPASVTLHEYETINEDGKYVILKPTIYQIIQELVNHFGGEQLGKIIISDVDTRIKQVVKWTGGNPLYIVREVVGGSTQYLATTDYTEAASHGAYKQYEYGEDIGYIYTDFTYPGELIGDAGTTVCDALDQIKNTLGNFEYFYDRDGNFIFQEVKNYLNTTQATVEMDKMNSGDYLLDMSKGKSVYSFDDSTLITSYSNSPQYSMIKNDFIVWGIREGSEGNKLPIRYHLAIDKKPEIGNTYNVIFFENEDELVEAKCPMVFPNKSSFPAVGQEEVFYMANDTRKIYKWDSKEKKYTELKDVNLQSVKTTDWRTELYLSGSVTEPLATNSNYYYTELKAEWPKIYDIKAGKFKEEALKHQTEIDFFLDFIDSSSMINELSVQNIGRRSKVISDNSINCVFEPEVPDLVLLDVSDPDIAELRNECLNQGQNFIQVDSKIFDMVAIGGKSNSAYNMVRELLYQYTSYNENISIDALPIFYLEPNSRITVRDVRSGIYGDYMIDSISIPFDVGGTMSLSCTRALERI
ncbi:MAG: putative flagellin-like protein [Caudoviricetes sp.]|nr:MAG: putative flagellin-like protein [Caudoviricetes sp.]